MNIVKIFAENFFLQLLFTVGLVAGVGFLIWLLRRQFYRLVGARKAVYYVTGFVGTPVHELGHAFFCIVFCHKIHKISLYRINPDDGVLGYVKHSYNRRNPYAQIGNFFIGVGPIIFGSAALLLCMFILAPQLLRDIYAAMNFLHGTNITIGNVFRAFWRVIVAFFAGAQLGNPLWWLFIFIASSIALNMSLSLADIKGSLWGFIFVMALFAIVNLVLAITGHITAFTGWCLSFGMFTFNFLIISVLLCLMLVIVAATMKGFFRLVLLKRV